MNEKREKDRKFEEMDRITQKSENERVMSNTSSWTKKKASKASLNWEFPREAAKSYQKKRVYHCCDSVLFVKVYWINQKKQKKRKVLNLKPILSVNGNILKKIIYI